MALAITFEHDGVPFRCWIEGHGAPETTEASTGKARWVVEVGGNIRALCEASSDDDPAEIQQRAIAQWREKSPPG